MCIDFADNHAKRSCREHQNFGKSIGSQNANQHGEQLARRLHVSNRTLGRRFSKAIGETPITFLQNARVERAKRLLQTTKISVDRVAYRVGYADVGSFRRLFLKAAGISPREYRQRFGTSHQT